MARKARLRQLVEDHKSGGYLARSQASRRPQWVFIDRSGQRNVEHDFCRRIFWCGAGCAIICLFSRIPLVAPYSSGYLYTLTVGTVSYLSLIVGELVPKRMGLSYAEPIAVRVSGLMSFFAVVAAPIVWVLKLSTEVILKLFGLNKPKDDCVTEEEIKDLIAQGTEKGVLKQAEKKCSRA